MMRLPIFHYAISGKTVGMYVATRLMGLSKTSCDVQNPCGRVTAFGF